MVKQRKLYIYKDDKHCQTVTFTKAKTQWSADHFERTGYMPFELHDNFGLMKSKMETEGLHWEWSEPLKIAG
jgi:hypothetical protein